MTVVADASVLVAGLVDSGPDGLWAEKLLFSENLVAPELVMVEVANVLRRAFLAGRISEDIATLAHADLLCLSIDLCPYEPFAERTWELRANLSAYDAWHVAVAEVLEAPMATLDRRLLGATGPRCRFLSPETHSQ